MITAARPLDDRLLDAVGSFLPRLAAALLILVIGWFLARLLGTLVRRGLHRIGFDDLGRHYDLGPVLGRLGLRRELSGALGQIIRVAAVIVVISVAISVLDITVLSESLNEGILFLPRLIAALVLVFVGILLGAIAEPHGRRLSDELDLPVPLGRLVQIVIVGVFVLTAAAQVAISTELLLVLVAIVLAAVLGVATIAFGLGGRDAARAVTAGRYLHEAYEEGATIEAAGYRGTVVAQEPAFVIVRLDDGRHVHLPNHLLLTTPVVVGMADETGAATPAGDDAEGFS